MAASQPAVSLPHKWRHYSRGRDDTDAEVVQSRGRRCGRRTEQVLDSRHPTPKQQVHRPRRTGMAHTRHPDRTGWSSTRHGLSTCGQDHLELPWRSERGADRAKLEIVPRKASTRHGQDHGGRSEARGSEARHLWRHLKHRGVSGWEQQSSGIGINPGLGLASIPDPRTATHTRTTACAAPLARVPRDVPQHAQAALHAYNGMHIETRLIPLPHPREHTKL